MLLGSKLFSDFFQQDSCLALCISAVQALCSLAGQLGQLSCARWPLQSQLRGVGEHVPY